MTTQLWMEAVMRLEPVILLVLVLAAFLTLSGCDKQQKGEKLHPKLQERLGVHVLEPLKHPVEVTYFQVTPVWSSKSRFKVSSEEKELPHDLQRLLQETLLDDQSYFFNKTKMCLFVPELGLRFSGKHEVLVLVSFSCRQIQFISNGQKRILDIDPHFSIFHTNFRELLTHF